MEMVAAKVLMVAKSYEHMPHEPHRGLRHFRPRGHSACGRPPSICVSKSLFLGLQHDITWTGLSTRTSQTKNPSTRVLTTAKVRLYCHVVPVFLASVFEIKKALMPETTGSHSRPEIRQSVKGDVLPSVDERKVGLPVLCVLALAVGLMTGAGAVALRALTALFHNISYNGTFSFLYDANVSEGPSRFGNFVFFAPVIGGLIVVFLVQRFAPEAKGHGVPEVMDSVLYNRGNIRGQVAVVKSLASAMSIGTGAAVGREGPIIQIGAALGRHYRKPST